MKSSTVALEHPPAPPSKTSRRARVVGAVAAQGSQALASMVLQVIAARLLGVEGLGRFAALYAVIVLATAISSGFVGDSLTVLDRSERRIRAGLQWWLLVLATVAAFIAGSVAYLTGFIDLLTALAFGVALFVFLVEDVVRRLLMAGLQFWRIVAVDMAGMAAAIVVIVLVDDPTLATLFWALAAGQVVALGVAWAVLPRFERWLAGWKHPDLGAVARYGVWRGVQQSVRPALLAAMRVVTVGFAGLAATGQLEAARIYMAPALLVVAGASSFLFASYAVDRGLPLRQSVRRADRSVLLLIGAVVLFGAVAVLALPWLGPILTDGEYTLSVTAVIGWAAYAASVAAVTPYGSLAAVRGRQAVVLLCRVGDSVLSLASVIVLVALTSEAQWVPLVLAGGSLLGGLAIRQLVLRREVDRNVETVSPDLDGALRTVGS